MEFIVIAVIIALAFCGIYAYWIYIIAKQYGKRANGRHSLQHKFNFDKI